MSSQSIYRGRLAPSPTGQLHLGIARTALVAWLFARRAGGVLIHRVEDLDGPRVVPGAAQSIADDLLFLGIDWDEGWCAPGTPADTAVTSYRQAQRAELYEQALAALRHQGRLFACSCTRREVALASAPHGQGDLGRRYAGTCYAGPTQPARPQALRFRMPVARYGFCDDIHGDVTLDDGDDFVVRRADGLYAYQLAVVVDDIAMGVNHVVRGADLLSSTPRQLALYAALGAEPPTYAHVPLLLNNEGQRLAKRDRAVAVADYRAAGVSAEQLVGALAASLGLCEVGRETMPAELVAEFDPARIGKLPVRFAPDRFGLPDL